MKKLINYFSSNANLYFYLYSSKSLSAILKIYYGFLIFAKIFKSESLATENKLIVYFKKIIQ